MFDLTLSFDNGPEPDVTPSVLDVLAARNIQTTFFVIGSKLQDPERRALSERAREEGHWIGNHTLYGAFDVKLYIDVALPRSRELG